MKSFEIKNISNSVLDVDNTSRRVKVAISEVESKDLDNDVIDKSAYNQTLKERGPQGANLIWHLTDHNPSLKSAVGKFSEIFMDGHKLVGVTNIPQTTWGNDVLEFYKTGHINQHSIGFKTIDSEIVNKGKSDEYNRIKKVMLFEGSAVLWGANPNTPMLSVGKALNVEEAKDEFDKLMDQLGGFHKMFKLGQLSDQTYELIEMKMNQLKDRLQQLFSFLPTDKVVETSLPADTAVSRDEELLSVLKTFNNNLKGKTENERARIESAA